MLWYDGIRRSFWKVDKSVMKMKSLMGLLDGGSDWIWCVVLGSVMVV